MTPTFKLSLWGPYALFSRPELKVERCSYEVITPSAAMRSEASSRPTAPSSPTTARRSRCT